MFKLLPGDQVLLTKPGIEMVRISGAVLRPPPYQIQAVGFSQSLGEERYKLIGYPTLIFGGTSLIPLNV